MNEATTLTELIEANRTRPHRITYLEGENQTREVSFAELYERSLGILYHLQRLGARRGDKLILFLTDNEQFIDAFWAAVLGGIVPVPVALGISDEHRMKLLRIARRLASRSSTPSVARSSASAPSPRRRARRRCTRRCASARSSWTISTTSRAPAACSAPRPATPPSSSSHPARPASRRAWC